MNHYAFTVAASGAGKTLLKAVRDAYPTAPQSRLLACLKTRDFKRNGIRLGENVKLSAGDVVEWYTLWTPEDITILYEDALLLICVKPAGLSSDMQAQGDASLIGWARLRAGDAYKPRLVHRLDQLTQGLLVLAKDDHTEAELGAIFRARTVYKRYECLCGGSPLPNAMLHAYLLKDAARGMVKVVTRPVPGAKPISTQYTLMGQEKLGNRLSVVLHTGRTHQIRAHLAHEGVPILGDDKYGDRALNKSLGVSRLMLAAVELRFPAGGPLGYLSLERFCIQTPF